MSCLIEWFKNNAGWIAFVSLIFSLSALIVTIFIRVDYELEIISQLLVIGFIGALATIVVVSNYAQVQDVRKDFEKQTIKVKEDFITITNQKLWNLQCKQDETNLILIEFFMRQFRYGSALNVFNFCYSENLESFFLNFFEDNKNWILAHENQDLDSNYYSWLQNSNKNVHQSIKEIANKIL